ncbi:hypothetical protein L345_15047, partial [Ophiophagus hannah]
MHHLILTASDGGRNLQNKSEREYTKRDFCASSKSI